MPIYARRRSKPNLGVGIDWSHPLAQGLKWFGAFNENSGLTLYDSALNGPALAGQSTPAWATTGSEAAMSFTGASQGAQVIAPAQLQLAWPITLVCRIRLVATRAASGAGLFGLASTNNNATPFRAAAMTFRGASAQSVSMEWNNAGTFSSNVAYAPVVGADVTLGAVFTAANQYFYADGKLVFTGSVAGGNPTYTTPILICGTGAGIAGTTNCLFYWGGVWQGNMPADWHAAIASNPWQIFQPPRLWSLVQGFRPWIYGDQHAEIGA